MPALRQIDCAELRAFGEWAGIEPVNDAFDFSATDRMTEAASAAGVQIAGVLLYAAPWALPPGTANTKTFPITRLDAWSDYVARVVGRYQGVASWEVWNEPNSPTFNAGNHSAADYAALARTAHAAAHAVQPGARVGLTVANFDVRYLRQAIASLAGQGAPDAFDFLAVHPYELLLRTLESDGELQYLAITDNLRRMVREVRPSKLDVPIRFTELGAQLGQVGEGVAIDQRVAAIALVKAYVLAIAQGVQRVDWFEAKDAGASQNHGLMDDDASTRLSYTTFRTLTKVLGAQPTYLGWLALGAERQGYGFVFGSRGKAQLVAWMPFGKRSTVRFAGRVLVHDVTTGQARTLAADTPLMLAEQPVLVTELAPGLIAEARANVRRPFPWGAPPVDANLARIDFGPRNLERGIDQDAPNTSEPHVFADGSTGVRVNVGRGRALYLAVHPSFANYDTREVYVRVRARTLRKSPPGHFTGMNLFYQPVTGEASKAPAYPFRNAGKWFGVPDDESWHSETWHLTDAMFVHTYGYSFYLQFDASDPFVIGTVELSKVAF